MGPKVTHLHVQIKKYAHIPTKCSCLFICTSSFFSCSLMSVLIFASRWVLVIEHKKKKGNSMKLLPRTLLAAFHERITALQVTFFFVCFFLISFGTQIGTFGLSIVVCSLIAVLFCYYKSVIFITKFISIYVAPILRKNEVETCGQK